MSKGGLDDIVKLFHLPIQDAASILGTSVSTLKSQCREYGIVKWPQRQLTSMSYMRKCLENAKVRDASVYELFDLLSQKRAMLYANPTAGLNISMERRIFKAIAKKHNIRPHQEKDRKRKRAIIEAPRKRSAPEDYSSKFQVNPQMFVNSEEKCSLPPLTTLYTPLFNFSPTLSPPQPFTSSPIYRPDVYEPTASEVFRPSPPEMLRSSQTDTSRLSPLEMFQTATVEDFRRSDCNLSQQCRSPPRMTFAPQYSLPTLQSFVQRRPQSPPSVLEPPFRSIPIDRLIH